MTGIEWRDRLAEQFGCLLKRWSRIETRNRNVFVPAYANILPNILDLVLDTTLKRKNSEQWDCDDFADDDRRVAVRIRTNSSYPDARKTLNLYKSQGLTEEYNRLVILVMATSLRNLRGTLQEECFFPERDLWSLEDLYHRIRELKNIHKIERICGYLDQMLDIPFDEPINLLRVAPRHTDNFVGRENELITLRNKLTEKKTIFITGIGGIGKTEVALRMAHLFAPPKGAYFLCCDSSIDEDKEVIRQVVLNAEFSGNPILRQGHNNHDQDYAKRMEIIKEQYKDALLIIDNLDLQKKSIQDIKKEDSYRELVESGVYLVFTTRYATEGEQIERMEDKELLKLMRKLYPSPAETDEKLLDLIDAVDGHTLVVVLAALTMKMSWGRITPDVLIDAFKKKKPYAKLYPLVKMDRNGAFSNRNMYDHLRIVFQMSGLSEQDKIILRYATLLPQEGLSEDLFWKAMVDCIQVEDESVNDAMNALTEENINSIVARGWLKKEHGKIMIHPVIRNVCQIELNPTDENERNLNEYLEVVFQLSGLSEQDQTILRYATLLPDEGLHEVLFEKAMVDCARADEELFYDLLNLRTEENINSVITRGWLKKENSILMIHPVIRNVFRRELKPTDENCGDFLDALWLQYKPKQYSVETYRQLAKLFQMAANKLEDREGIWCLRAGLFWNRLGEVDRALECFLKTVERQKTSTDNTVDLVRTYNKIGSAYQALDKLPEAQVNFIHALSIAKRNPKTDPYTLASTLTNLGSVYGDLGDYESALENRMRALEILKGYYPKNHPALATSYSNLGSVYSARGDYKTSLSCYLKALEIREDQSTSDSDEDLDLAKTYNNIGGNYFRLRDYLKAQDYLLKALLIRERLLPDGHPDLVRSYNNMGGLYIRMGDDRKALEYLQKALKLRNQVSLDEYLGLATIYNNIAAIYTKMGDFEQGLDNLLEALSLQEKIDPPKRPDIAQTHSNIAWTYYGMGNYQKAEEHIGKAVMIAKEVLPANHIDLDMYYRAESRFREKRQICEEVN